MLLIFSCMLAAAAAAPVTYDQSQEGRFNIRADLQNILVLMAIPKLNLPTDLIISSLLSKSNGREAVQDRADVQVMEAFVEPSTPYRVEIGTEGSERSVEADGRGVEVVIAGRRRSDVEPEPERDELKLLGAMEQCGPDRERDPVSLTCHPMRSQVVPEETPEVVLASS